MMGFTCGPIVHVHMYISVHTYYDGFHMWSNSTCTYVYKCTVHTYYDGFHMWSNSTYTYVYKCIYLL